MLVNQLLPMLPIAPDIVPSGLDLKNKVEYSASHKLLLKKPQPHMLAFLSQNKSFVSTGSFSKNDSKSLSALSTTSNGVTGISKNP